MEKKTTNNAEKLLELSERNREKVNCRNLLSHLSDARKINTITRYHTKNSVKPTNVGGHSWFVAKLASHIATYEIEVNKADIDLGKVLFLAINHDVAEAFTGDIPSPVKDYSPAFRKAYDEMEEKMVEDLIVNKVPYYEKDRYMLMNTDYAKLNSIESRIVKASDILDRVFECLDEIRVGNLEEYIEIIGRDTRTLLDYNIQAVNEIIYEIYSKYRIFETAEKYDATANIFTGLIDGSID